MYYTKENFEKSVNITDKAGLGALILIYSVVRLINLSYELHAINDWLRVTGRAFPRMLACVLMYANTP